MPPWLLFLCQRIWHGLAFLYSQMFIEPPYPIRSWADKTVIVTGANSGLGLEAARHFVRLGAAKVILAVRNLEKGEAAKKSIEASTERKGVVEVWQLDLCSYASVEQLAERASMLTRIDAVVLNAGIAPRKFQKAGGNETTITTNLISNILLLLLLMPTLKNNAQKYKTRPHVSVVCSEVIFHTSFPEATAPNIFAKLNDERTARMSDRYYVSKLMVAMACRELAARRPQDYPVVINYLNPGLCHSGLLREEPPVVYAIKAPLARTAEVGSRTLIHAAAAGPSSHGQYLNNCTITDPPRLLTMKEGADKQRRVWNELSEKLKAIHPGIMGNL